LNQKMETTTTRSKQSQFHAEKDKKTGGETAKRWQKEKKDMGVGDQKKKKTVDDGPSWQNGDYQERSSNHGKVHYADNQQPRTTSGGGSHPL